MARASSSARRLAAVLLAGAFVLGAFPASAKTLDVVASFSVLADVVREVGGDHVRVKSLVPPQGDPHEFEPSPNDARALKAADVVFISGEGLESWLRRLAKAAGYAGEPVVVSKDVKTLTMEEDGRKVVDPHVWNAAPNVIIWTRAIERALAAADPQDAGAFRANAEAYRRRLEALDAYARERIGATPQERRRILTSHDAFGYFGAEYGVVLLAPLGVSTEAEASAGGVARLIDQIRKEHVGVYFIEASNDARLVKQIAEAAGAQPGGELYAESLSGPDGPAPSYEKMFRANVDKIADALARQNSAGLERR